MSRTINLAVIPGDGIGTEVVGEGLKVLDVVAAKYGVTFNKTHYDLGAGYWHRTGEVLPDSVLAELAKSDVILLGAVGDPSVPSGMTSDLASSARTESGSTSPVRCQYPAPKS